MPPSPIWAVTFIEAETGAGGWGGTTSDSRGEVEKADARRWSLRKVQSSSDRGQHERPRRHRDRTLAAQQAGIHVLECDSGARGARARQCRPRSESLTRQRKRSTARVAVRPRRQVIGSEAERVGCTGRRQLNALTGWLNRHEVPGACELVNREGRRRGDDGSRRRRRAGKRLGAPNREGRDEAQG
jgi:hypothetical protein